MRIAVREMVFTTGCWHLPWNRMGFFWATLLSLRSKIVVFVQRPFLIKSAAESILLPKISYKIVVWHRCSLRAKLH